jgi:hypothetical protein
VNKGESRDMQQWDIDRLARALAQPRSRRQAIAAVGAAILGGSTSPALGARRARQRTKQNGAFPRKCRRFIITAGPNRNDRFEHTDDDLLIEIIPKGRGQPKIVFNDDNGSPNGPNGDHLRVEPFSARVGDRVHIVARNAVAGGCELDEIWLHCIEGRGGKIKLTDRITPEECSDDANRVGIFFDETVRIHN